MALQFDNNKVNAIISTTLFPQIVEDLDGTDQFHSWRVSSVFADPSTIYLSVLVSAIRKVNGELLEYKVSFDPSYHLQRDDITNLVRELDYKIQAACCEIVLYNSLHTEGVLCQNNFCEECYK